MWDNHPLACNASNKKNSRIDTVLEETRLKTPGMRHRVSEILGKKSQGELLLKIAADTQQKCI